MDQRAAVDAMQPMNYLYSNITNYVFVSQSNHKSSITYQ